MKKRLDEEVADLKLAITMAGHPEVIAECIMWSTVEQKAYLSEIAYTLGLIPDQPIHEGES